jgi:O-antigen/teichoic acid export membrane protein
MRAVFIVVVGRLLQMSAVFVTLKLSTTLMSPGQIGQINQMVAFTTLFATGIVVPLVVYFARGIVGWVDAGQFRRRLREVMIAIAVATLVLTPVAIGIQAAGAIVHDIDLRWFAALFALYVFGFSSYTLLLNCVAVLGQRVRGAAYSNLASWSGLALAVILFAMDESPWLWTLGVFLGFAIAVQGLWAVGFAQNGEAVSGASAPQSLKPATVWAFVWPQVAMFALWWIQSQSYRFVLAEVSTMAAVGLFYAAYALISVPMQAFEAAFNEVYSPTLYRDFEAAGADGRVQAWNRYVYAYMPSILVFGCFLAGCAPHITRLALGPAFQIGALFFVWPAIAEVCRALASVNHTLGVAKVDMRLLLPPALAGAVVAPMLVLLLAPAAPLSGTGAALCAASLAVLGVVYAKLRKVPGLRWPWGRLGVAAMAGLPLPLVGVMLDAWILHSPAAALGACLLLGGYALVVLYVFARPWLRLLRRTSALPA